MNDKLDDKPDKDEMVLAFGFQTVCEIVQADGQMLPAEMAQIDKSFPRERLFSRGLLSQGGPTARFGHAYNLSLAKLKTLLTHEEKIALADTFFDACRADAEVDPAEVQVIVRAMQVLGVSKAELADHMRARIARGQQR